MRFSLSNLFLIIPAFFFAYICALFLALPAFETTKADIASLEISRYLFTLQAAKAYFDTDSRYQLSKQDIDDWFSGTLDSNHPLTRYLDDGPYSDPWGNPYRCRQIGLAFGVYSLGRDSKSVSFGDDADDLNSWDDPFSKSLYQSEQDTKHRIRHIAVAFLILPFAYCALLWMHRTWRRRRVAARGQTEYEVKTV